MPSATITKRVIAVFGATGAQGGSVVKHLLEDPSKSFSVRALTRNVESPKAKALSTRGVEVVKADLDDPSSLQRALAGAYGVFGVTNFWESLSRSKEIEQGKRLVDAAAAASVQHLVWSTLDHTEGPDVPHWNSKADIDDYLKKSGVGRTSLYTSFYYENFLSLMPFTKGEGEKLVADWPILLTDGPIGGYSVAETGAYVREALAKPHEWIGKDMRILSDVFTPREFVRALGEATGVEIELRETDRERFDGRREIEGEAELWSNMEWFYKHNGNPNRDPELTLRIHPKRVGLREFVEANKEALIANVRA